MMVWTYLIYVAVSVAVTIWVGQSLHASGRIFLVENFQGREKLADSVNHLLLVGFYLVNIGFVCLTCVALRRQAGRLEEWGRVGVSQHKDRHCDPRCARRHMHFFNMRMLVRFRQSPMFGRLAAEVGAA